jgi:hypothetical protein
MGISIKLKILLLRLRVYFLCHRKKLKVLAIFLIIATALSLIYFSMINKTSASAFLFKQINWKKAPYIGDANAVANYPDNNSGFTDYSSKNANITINENNNVTLAPPNVQNVGDANYSAVTADGFFVDASNSNSLTLKKPDGATCVNTSECATSTCVDNVCMKACGSSTVCGDTCAFSGKAYGTKTLGSTCWFTRNLNTGVDIGNRRYCYGNVASNCDTYGIIYGNNTLSQVCPTGWRVANLTDWTTLRTNYTYGQLISGGSSGFDALLGGYSPYSNPTFINIGTHGGYATGYNGPGIIFDSTNQTVSQMNYTGGSFVYGYVRCAK